MTIFPTLDLEQGIFGRGVRRIAALDEVGRGAMAGPVTVGAVIITAEQEAPPEGLRDSKLLSAAARHRLVEPIKAWVTGWSVGHASPADVDRIGIMGALRLAALRALGGLPGPVDEVLLDGNVNYVNAVSDVIPLAAPGDQLQYDDSAALLDCAPFGGTITTVVKGDRDCASIAAASVLAKVTRDRIMVGLHDDFPQYGWAKNKGYGTAEHAAALLSAGPCIHHRRSWRLPVADAAPLLLSDGG